MEHPYYLQRPCDPCHPLFPWVAVPPSSLQRTALVRPSWPLRPVSPHCPKPHSSPQALFSLWCHPCFLGFSFFLLCLLTTVLSHLEQWCWVTSACHLWAVCRLAWVAVPLLHRHPKASPLHSLVCGWWASGCYSLLVELHMCGPATGWCSWPLQWVLAGLWGQPAFSLMSPQVAFWTTVPVSGLLVQRLLVLPIAWWLILGFQLCFSGGCVISLMALMGISLITIEVGPLLIYCCICFLFCERPLKSLAQFFFFFLFLG